MPLEPERKEKAPFRWRLEDAYRTVTAEAFVKVIAEHGLTPQGPFGGYWYALLHTTEGEELYRTWSGSWDDIPVTVAVTADPAAGANLAAITVPAKKRWLFLGSMHSVVTDATVVTRQPFVRFARNGTNTDQEIVSPNGITASLTAYVTFGDAASATATVTARYITSELAPVDCPAGTTISHLMGGLVAGDNIGVCYYAYKQVDYP